MKTLSINFASSYPIYIGHNLLNSQLFLDYCAQLNKRLAIITDTNLENTLGKDLQRILDKYGLNVDLIVFPAGEVHKTREMKQCLEDKLLAKHFGRDTSLIALGGGVVTDLIGFLAATYCRGVPVIYIPTTLLAMVDASIGGKTGVNTPFGKNLIGCFNQPQAVFIDINTLNSLPDAEFANGMAEIIKHSMIANSHLFDMLNNESNKIKQGDPESLIEVIYTNCLIKKTIIEQDEKDHGIRQLLNFGHTIGHAIEAHENYHISHGQAVAIGMLVECYLSIQCGFLQDTILIRLKNLLQHFDLPLKTSAFVNRQAIKKLLKLDKKSVNSNPYFVLLEDIGKPKLSNGACTMPVDSTLLDSALEWARLTFE